MIDGSVAEINQSASVEIVPLAGSLAVPAGAVHPIVPASPSAPQLQPPAQVERLQFSIRISKNNAFNRWVAQNLGGQSGPADGALLYLEQSGRVVKADQWVAGSVTQLDLPALDSGSAAPIDPSVTVSATPVATAANLLSMRINSGGGIRAASATSQFRVSPRSPIDLSRAVQVSALRLSAQNHGGTVSIVLPRDASMDAALKAVHNAATARTGLGIPPESSNLSIELLSPNLKNVYATVVLQNCIITGVDIPKAESNSARLLERITVTYAYTDASIDFAWGWQ